MKLGICIALAALIWMVFGESSRFDWVRYDDGDYVYRSGHVTSGLNLQNVIWSFTNFHAHNWHPITTLSHIVDCQLFGVTPGAAHVVNVILHALGAIILFLALNSLGIAGVAAFAKRDAMFESRLSRPDLKSDTKSLSTFASAA